MSEITALKEIADNILIDEPMKNHTSFRIGGNADYLVEPTSVEQLIKLIRLCKKIRLPYQVIGNG